MRIMMYDNKTLNITIWVFRIALKHISFSVRAIFLQFFIFILRITVLIGCNDRGLASNGPSPAQYYNYTLPGGSVVPYGIVTEPPSPTPVPSSSYHSAERDMPDTVADSGRFFVTADDIVRTFYQVSSLSATCLLKFTNETRFDHWLVCVFTLIVQYLCFHSTFHTGSYCNSVDQSALFKQANNGRIGSLKGSD